ncbi:MAG TPA: hypothetical protein VFN68_07120 [Acidimicrobiales bacterium]|nr:hypothetical protein [Acidimicrobiales bacterium]
MARDEEFRRVAEDLRALGRSLARDFWQAADQARRSGRPPGRVISHGLRHMAGEARRGMWGGGHWRGYGPYRGYGWPAGPQVPWDPRNRPAPPPGPSWPTRRRPPQPPPARPGPPRPARPPVRRRWDATTLLGLLIVVFGSAWLLGAVNAVQVPTEGVVAIGLMVLGVAVIVTARTDWSLSRRAWPLWVGAALVVVAVTASSTFGIAGTLNHVSFGAMQRTAVAGRTVYGGFGNLSVDGTALAPGARVTVESAAGRTDISTPPGVPVEVHARVLAGQVCVGGQAPARGLDATVDGLFRSGAAQPVTLDVHQLAGDVIIDGGRCNQP